MSCAVAVLSNFRTKSLRFLNNGSRILVITQRHKLGMTKPIGYLRRLVRFDQFLFPCNREVCFDA